MFVRAPYMEWAKSRPSPRFDLAVSAVAACHIDDLPGARQAVDFGGRSENGYAPLVDAIARRYGVERACVATAQGTSGANLLVCAALIGPGDDVLVEWPAYDPLLAAPALFGARLVRFTRRPEEGFALRAAEVRRALTPRTRLVILTNPHNPTGALASDEELCEVAAAADEVGAHVLVDEVYLDAAAGGRRRPAARLSPRMISTSSLTKSYGLAGLRCGWTLATPEIAGRVHRARDVVDGTGSILAERLATLAFEHLDRLATRARDLLAPGLAQLRTALAVRNDVEWLEPQGGPVAFPRLPGVDIDAFVDRLIAEEETIVVPGRFFDVPDRIRIGFGVAPSVLEGGLAAIARTLDRLA